MPPASPGARTVVRTCSCGCPRPARAPDSAAPARSPFRRSTRPRGAFSDSSDAMTSLNRGKSNESATRHRQGVPVHRSACRCTCAGSSWAQAPTEAPRPVTFTVTTVAAESAPALSKADVQLFLGNERKPVAGWAEDDNLHLAILIDDTIGRRRRRQLERPRGSSSWRNRRPRTSPWGTSASAWRTLARDFTTDHEAAASALLVRPWERRGPPRAPTWRRWTCLETLAECQGRGAPSS